MDQFQMLQLLFQSYSSDTASAEVGRQAGSHHGEQAAADPRDTLEYKTALELEMWKEQQEAMFQAQVTVLIIS